MARPHLKNGVPCDCDLVYSDDPAYYAEQHPNKEPNFNEQIAEDIHKTRFDRRFRS